RISTFASKLDLVHLYSTDDLSGLRNFAAAENLIKAGQVRQGIQFYWTALRSGSSILPTEDIGRKLDQFKETHPEEYQLAMMEPIPTPVSYPMIRGHMFPATSQPRDPTTIVLPMPSSDSSKDKGKK
ncbi:MAG: hypothetical protein AAGC68_00300, partial [Verrucomicrobiota bacterium]